MKSALVLLLIFTAFLATCLLMGKMMHIAENPVRGYLDGISLSKEQKSKVEQIRKDFHPKVEAIRQGLREKRLQLDDLIFAQKPDTKAIESKSKEISDLQAALEREVVHHILQEKDVLTPDQKKQFYEIIKNEFEKGGLGIHGERRQESNLTGEANGSPEAI